MSYSLNNKQSRNSGFGYGSSNLKGYSYNRLTKLNYSVNRLTGYSPNIKSNPVYTSVMNGLQIYNEFMKSQPKYERQESYGKGESLNRNIPTIRVTAPSFSSLGSFLSSSIGKGGGKSK